MEILLASCVKISIICGEHLDWRQSFSVIVANLSKSCMPYCTSIWHVCKHFWFPKYFEKVLINEKIFTVYIDRSFVLPKNALQFTHIGVGRSVSLSKSNIKAC